MNKLGLGSPHPHIPQSSRSVLRGRYQQTPIWTEFVAQDGTLVLDWLHQGLAGAQIVQASRAVVQGPVTDAEFLVWRNIGEDGRRGKRGDLLLQGSCIQNAHSLSPAGNQQAFSVGGHQDVVPQYLIRVALEFTARVEIQADKAFRRTVDSLQARKHASPGPITGHTKRRLIGLQ